MKIAVTYDNGNVFQHFGHTEQFKVYDVEDGRVVSSDVIGSNGSGHGALADLLADRAIDVLICGGIGPGAQAALSDCGIELCAGASGSADAAVEAYLRGELVNTGANCDHHDHGEGHSCHDHGEGHCHAEGHGHGEGHGGGCHHEPSVKGKNAGKKVRAHYRGTFNDGTQFDSSYDRGEPLEFVCGAGMMIPGFDAAVANMEVGETVQVHLMPEEAYGYASPAAIMVIPMKDLPGCEALEVGQRVMVADEMGRRFPVTVTAKDDVNITLDANHQMAGKELNFRIELVSAE